MTFLKRRSEVLRTTKLTRIVFVLVPAVAVVSVGYIIALAVLAPQQLADATTAATDLVCTGCVGTTDIASNAVTSGKIGSGQVHNADIGNNAVTNAKIQDGQVFSNDIADITIVSSDIADNAITASKLAGGAVKVNGPHVVFGDATPIASRSTGNDRATCPIGYALTGGGYSSSGFPSSLRVYNNQPEEDAWFVSAFNEGTVTQRLACICTVCRTKPVIYHLPTHSLFFVCSLSRV